MKKTLIILLLFTSCQRITEEEKCVNEFEFGAEIVFKIDTLKHGIVMQQSSYYCDIYNVSYFDDKGIKHLDRFNKTFIYGRVKQIK